MISAVLVVAAALWRHPATGSLSSLALTTSDVICGDWQRTFYAEAAYRVWHYIRTRVDSFSFAGLCLVNVALPAAASPPQQPEQRRRLLLVRVEDLRLEVTADDFRVKLWNPTRWSVPFCNSGICSATYLWASESVQLYFYRRWSAEFRASYKAAIVVTEATNVCGRAIRSGELMVYSGGDSSEYVFAPDVKNDAIPPNNASCTADLNYSLTLRPYVASALLNVTVLALPSSGRCATLMLNERPCRDSESFFAPLPGSNVALNYVLRSCRYYTSFTGFVVSVQAGVSADVSTSLRPSSTSSARSWTGGALASSSPPDSTASSSVHDKRDSADGSNQTVVAASVATVAAATLAIGITVALLCRRRSLRHCSTFRTPPSGAPHQAQNAASSGDEVIAMVTNDLYGVTLATGKTAHQ